LYVPMGWMVLVAMSPLIERMATPDLLVLLAGGVIYTLGAVVFLLERPRLWPGRFGSHDLWHLMVLAGAGCHYWVVLHIIGQ
jgi:hemolysin III